MALIWWFFILVCFLLSFIGIIYPIIPGVGLIWLGAAIYHLLINSDALTWTTWGTFTVFTALILLSDQSANYYVVRRHGTSRLGVWAAVVGVIIGAFIMPPFGLLFVPFLFVLVAEISQNRPLDRALTAAFATLVAFVTSAVAKAILHVLMIIIFFLDMA